MKTGIRILAAAGALWVAGSVGAAGVPGQGTWETTLLPRDINGDSVVDAYYDTALGISWLADADPVPGTLDWPTAAAFAGSLSVHGVTGWRLPSTVDDGTRSAAGFSGPGSSEMAHMYLTTLGNSIALTSPPIGLTNTGPFSDLMPFYYWSQTADSATPGAYWAFMFEVGFQNSYYESGVRQNDGRIDPFFAWAVHDGDVAPSPIPEPSALILIGLGLAGLYLRRRS